MGYLKIFHITPDLKEATYRLNEALVVVVTHTLNFSIMILDTAVQALFKLRRFWSFIHTPA